MFKKKLEIFFIATIFIALSYMLYSYYDSYTYKHNDISEAYKQRILDKEREVLSLMKKHYGVSMNIPLIVTDKFKGRLYGLTSYEKGKITIYLNKKVMKESMNYIVDSVIAHEYAHALMFKLGNYKKGDGHSSAWQEACVKIGGLNCDRYVNGHDVVMAKML